MSSLIQGEKRDRWATNDEINFDNNTIIEGSPTAIGTLANCSGGITPWRTILTCEENYDMFYGERNLSNRMISKTSYDVGWTKYFPFPPEHYGWVVEIDPFSGKKRKLVSLGRCAHECATVKVLNDKRLVVYTGDDMENGCLYKFISESKVDLTNGQLYVASMEKKKWILQNTIDMDEEDKSIDDDGGNARVSGVTSAAQAIIAARSKTILDENQADDSSKPTSENKSGVDFSRFGGTFRNIETRDSSVSESDSSESSESSDGLRNRKHKKKKKKKGKKSKKEKKKKKKKKRRRKAKKESK